MKRFSNCLLVSDYDNTLTGPDGTVPSKNLAAIDRFMSMGGRFTVATGRSLPTFRRRLKKIPVNAPVLVCNGAACWDSKTEQFLLTQPLPEDWSDLTARLTDRYPILIPEVQSSDCHWLLRPSPMREHWLSKEDTAVRHADSIQGPAINLIFYIAEKDPYLLSPNAPEALLLSALAQEIHALPGYEAVHSAPGMLEVQAAGVTKGNSARALTKQLGCDFLICVGDAPNDLSMLQEADLACVPADCHPQIATRGFHALCPSGGGTLADLITRLEQNLL